MKELKEKPGQANEKVVRLEDEVEQLKNKVKRLKWSKLSNTKIRSTTG